MSANSPILSTLSEPYDPQRPLFLTGIFSNIISTSPVSIAAPAEQVWKHMVDFEQYPQWNPLNRYFELDTFAAVGEKVTFGVAWGPYYKEGKKLPLQTLKQHLTQHEVFTTWHENRALAYADQKGVFLRAERVQVITVIDENNCEYCTYERCQGLLSPVISLLYKKKIINSFTEAGLALKALVESHLSASTSS